MGTGFHEMNELSAAIENAARLSGTVHAAGDMDILMLLMVLEPVSAGVLLMIRTRYMLPGGA